MAESRPSDFIRDMVTADVKAGKHGGRVCTRFPPEPNGYLHLGHAKSICLNFGLAKEFHGVCHLRMDDTNPTTEDPEYVASIQNDVRWLGFDWADKMFYASDYFERLYELAEGLIRKGRAYVDDLTEEQMGEYRGTITEAGKDSPFRTRTVEENLDLFRRMRKGEFKEGEKTLRARIDMAHPNMKLRDPPLYRIKHAHHYRAGDQWCIYPLYDYAHCLSDSFEGITHSLCTLEFESARALYDWVLQATEVPHVSHQTEFARLNVTYVVLSKRRLLELVTQKHVAGWDDPRMPTLAGLRRRGCTPEALREFCARIGMSKNLSVVEMGALENALRDDLGQRSPRVLAVLHPLKLIIENYPAAQVEELPAALWPAESGRTESRTMPFSRELFIEKDDFREDPPADFHRLAPGRRVRLRHGYLVTCTGVDKKDGVVTAVRCTYDPATKGGVAPDGVKVDGTIHWVSAAQALDAEVRLYDRLFTTENPGEISGNYLADLNPASLLTVKAKVEPSLAQAKPGERFQFERQGYFYVDPDSKPGTPIFNRTVTLKDSWAKVQVKPAPRAEPVARAEKVKHAPKAAAELSEAAKAIREKHGIHPDEARVLDAEPLLRALFDEALAAKAPAKAVAGLLCNDVLGEMRSRRLDKLPFDGGAVAELVALVDSGKLSTHLAKEVMTGMFQGEGAPAAIVAKRGLVQISDTGALDAVVTKVLAANAEVVSRYKAGNANLLGALVGLAMRESGGRANPKAITEALRRQLS